MFTAPYYTMVVTTSERGARVGDKFPFFNSPLREPHHIPAEPQPVLVSYGLGFLFREEASITEILASRIGNILPEKGVQSREDNTFLPSC